MKVSNGINQGTSSTFSMNESEKREEIRQKQLNLSHSLADVCSVYFV